MGSLRITHQTFIHSIHHTLYMMYRVYAFTCQEMIRTHLPLLLGFEGVEIRRKLGNGVAMGATGSAPAVVAAAAGGARSTIAWAIE
jgi:hypothetical protein